MMKNIAAHIPTKKWFNNFFWPASIFLITLLIIITNYVPGKWLTGWDTLHPEFNFPSQISNVIFGVWRQDQGLGAVAAHSHMSDLPRIITLWLGSFVLPDHFLRLGFVYLCFIMGPLGIYYFIKNGIFEEKSGYIIHASAFLGALVYIFNLGTVQHFYVVFEMFAVQYSVLGWLFLFTIKSLYSENPKYLLAFFVISLFSTPMAYASQLWFAYFGALILFLIVLNLEERKRNFFKKSLFVIGATLAANSFWLLPNLYFLLTDAAKIPANSHINRLFSPESFLHNANFGKIQDVAIFRNFLFNWLDLKNDGRFGDLLPQWKEHIGNIWIISIGYAIFAFSLIGLTVSVLKKKKVETALLPIILLSIFMLMNMNPPFNYIFGWLRDNVAIFREGLRTPFTKFSLLLMFSTSVYFSVFMNEVMKFIRKIIKVSLAINISLVFLVSFVLGLYGLPLLQGQLINKKLLNDIPQPYFSLYDWLETQPDQARIINLPLQTPIGWEFYDWGYEGAGFIWFGMNQPMTVRDFDRWNPHNETLYKELSAALYGNDPQTFIETLEKFDISYLLLDESIINPNDNTDTVKKPEIKNLLAEIGLKPAWQENFLSIYDVRLLVGSKSFVYVPDSLVLAIGDVTYSKRDPIYQGNGPYVSGNHNLFIDKQPIMYPFADYLKDQTPFVEYGHNQLIIKENIAELTDNAKLILPPLAQGEEHMAQISLNFTNGLVTVDFNQQIIIKTGSDQFALPSLPSVALPIPLEFQNVIIEIGEKQIEIQQGQTIQTEANLQINRPVVISAFNFAEIEEEEDQRFIDSNRVASISLSTESWDSMTQEHTVDLKPSSELVIQISSIPYSPEFANPNSVSNCDLMRKNESIKKIVADNVVYQSVDLGVACDGADLFDLNQHSSYLMRWQIENISGRTIKLNLQNIAAGRSDLEELIPDSSREISYGILPWPYLENEGYYLSWENRSFGSEISENIIENIEIYPVPLDFISRIVIKPQSESEKIINHAKISNLWKVGTYQYGFKVDNPDIGLVALSQTYENGWIAINLSNLHLLDHVIYNGWANAWVLPEGSYHVIVFFWPQLLEFAGFLILTTTAILLINIAFNPKFSYHE